MNILTTEYSLAHKALEVYVAGCNPPHCPGCHNPEGWAFDQGTPWKEALPSLLFKAQAFSRLVRNIWVLGGEPLDQDHSELCEFLVKMRGTGKTLWVFTRYTEDLIPDWLLKTADYIKTGPYKENLNSVVQHGIRLASSNQRIITRQ